MKSSEWLDLFFYRAFENGINSQIMEDWDYEVPSESLLNYVHNLIAIPYKDFIDRIVKRDDSPILQNADVPKHINIEDCQCNLIKFLTEELDRGITTLEVGEIFNETFSQNDAGKKQYGRYHLVSSSIQGFVYEYYGKWYLNCLSYVFLDLTSEQQTALIARLLLRSPLYAKLVKDAIDGNVRLAKYFPNFEEGFVFRYLSPTQELYQYCQDAASCENIFLGNIIEFEENQSRLHFRKQWSFMRRMFQIEKSLSYFVDQYIYYTPLGSLDIDYANKLIMDCFVESVYKDRISHEEDNDNKISNFTDSSRKVLKVGLYETAYFEYYSIPARDNLMHVTDFLGRDYVNPTDTEKSTENNEALTSLRKELKKYSFLEDWMTYVLKTSIIRIKLPIRISRVLYENGYSSLIDLFVVKKEEDILSLPTFGNGSLCTLNKFLFKIGVKFGRSLNDNVLSFHQKVKDKKLTSDDFVITDPKVIASRYRAL